MPNSLQSSAIASPASRRATNCTLSSITEHSFQGITPSPLRGKVSPMCPVQCVTYVSGRSSSRLPGVVPKTSTHNPAHISLHHLRTHSQRRHIFPVRRPCFVAVVLRVQIERRLTLRVTTDSLDGLGFDFRLVHQPVV